MGERSDDKHNMDSAEGTEQKPVSSSEQDLYFYTKRDFTSEIYKIEIENLPKYIGFSQLRKFLNVKLELDACKVKVIGSPPHHAFVTFKNEEKRNSALQVLNGYSWKGKNLLVKLANPAADPYAAKRKAGHSDESIPRKIGKQGEATVNIILKNVVTPLWSIPYEEQLKKKELQVELLLKKLKKGIEKINKDFKSFLSKNSENNGKCCPVEPIKPSPSTSAYRNKCEFSIGRDLFTKMRTVGFRLNRYKEGSMSVAAPDDCINISEAMLKALKSFESYVRQSDKEVYSPDTHDGYWKQLTVRTSKSSDVLLIVVMHPQDLSEEDLEKEKAQLKDYFEKGAGSSCGVTSLYFQTFDKMHAAEERGNIIHLLGKPYIEEILFGMKFQISPEAFFQVNVDAAEVLYETIAQKVGILASPTVLDICCGTGTIGLFLAKRGAKVIGIEMCSEAIENAKVNAEINGITTAEFICGKAEDVLVTAVKKSEMSEVIAVANPPRAGLHPKVLKIIRASENIKKLIYVSCNPKAALNNFIDLGRPTSNNYRGAPFYPVQVIPIDMFPHTPHYELVLVFERYCCT